jgi:hypothetical protein
MLVTDEVHLGAWITRLHDEADAPCSQARRLERLLRLPTERVCIDCAMGRQESGREGFCGSGAGVTLQCP